MLKPLKTIIITIIMGIMYMMPTVARAACAENEIDVLGDGTQCETAKFTVTTTEIADGETFQFYMSAKGTFYVDWGDGNIRTISRTNTTNTRYTHTYTNTGIYNIRFGGVATGYVPTSLIPVFTVSGSSFVAGILGSLGALFPTIGNGLAGGTQPRFYKTFADCPNLTSSIPENLFDGVVGPPTYSMFPQLFENSGITGSIPENLFSGISGAPANSMFSQTFAGCSGLTGSIPENLFAGISGAPASHMFDGTFSGCSGLTGSIPENLFAGISGAPADSMFSSTFSRCSGLNGSIPGNLFSGISGAPAIDMFSNTFNGCSGLTGSIPENLFAGISGAPADSMFYGTFYQCSGLTGSIPENLFDNLSGEGAFIMFAETFYGCSNLSGYVPKNIFENITSPGEYGTDFMFEETNLYTECPCGSVSAETGWGAPLVDGRAVCEVGLKENEHIYNDVCVGDCGAGVTTLRTSTGLEFPLFDTKPTTPSLHIQHNGTVCYTPMEPGNGGANSMNFMSGGAAYHLGTLE